ncbi:H-2 class II histocompatibility antigen, A-U alpha chain-like [Genypterus blacodes]|uniref:H-2 class II histocompatibility antigen, A-U alpha chain-like n=1 Tax=Genypterus blacodes TaxID=154954 RepID=UPI003F75A06A
MERSIVTILLLNTVCAFSELPHEAIGLVGCFLNGVSEDSFQFDGEEIFYSDFKRNELVYTMPAFLHVDPSSLIDPVRTLRNAKKHRFACTAILTYLAKEEKNPPEEKDIPESVIYAAEEIQLEVENMLICHVTHLYPPSIKFIWTKNGREVSHGVSVSRYYPSTDGTLHMFSTLTFTPADGDIYGCTIEHSALEKPQTRLWESDLIPRSVGPDVFCGFGLTVGFLGVAIGTFLIVKGHHATNS